MSSCLNLKMKLSLTVLTSNVDDFLSAAIYTMAGRELVRNSPFLLCLLNTGACEGTLK